MYHLSFGIIVIFAVVYGVYFRTLYESVPGGDSGELLAEICVLGTPHPPGYPLFVILSRLVAFALTLSRSHVPASVAWKVNNLCAMLGSLSAVFVWLTSVEILESLDIKRISHAAAVLGAVLFAFSPLVWEYSLTAEVFALNNVLCACLLWLCCKLYNYVSTGNNAHVRSAVYLGAFLSGLALANQHASLLTVAYLVLCVFCLLAKGDIRSFPKIISISSICFFAGLSPYVYLVIAGGHVSQGSWGDTSTIRGFLRHVLRSEYGTFQLGVTVGSEGALTRIASYLNYVSTESYHMLAPVFIIGVWRSFVVVCKTVKVLPTNKGDFRKNTDVKQHSGKQGLKRGRVQDEAILLAASVTSPVGSISPPPSRVVPTARGIWRGGLLLMVASGWIFYLLIWHFVFSNLPLNSPMPFAVHARFWMQPNIFFYSLFGAFVSLIFDYVKGTLLSNYVLSENGNAAVSAKASAVISMTGAAIEVLVVACAVWMVLQDRLMLMDRSGHHGMTMHAYGDIALQSLPQNSLLLSHTDLDWNPIRYLQHCEKRRPDVTHLSFQLMPYPWFLSRQGHLYPKVKFPDLNFAGISTDRRSEGNARLISMFLRSNEVHTLQPYEEDSATASPHLYPGGVYIDLQAINDADFLSFGRWRQYMLVPWGTLYRVYGQLNGGNYTNGAHNLVIQALHIDSMNQLLRLQTYFPPVNAVFVAKFPPGSWEFAAASVFYDAHYQMGAHLLEFCVELQTTVTIKSLPILLDRLYYAALLLRKTKVAQQIYGTFSSHPPDLHKNMALAWARLHGLFAVLHTQDAVVRKTTIDLFNTAQDQQRSVFLDFDALSSLFSASTRQSLTQIAMQELEEWIQKYPNDKDYDVFYKIYRSMSN